MKKSGIKFLFCLSFLLCFLSGGMVYAQTLEEEAQRADSLMQEGIQLFRQSDSRGALEKWLAGLDIAKKHDGWKEAVGSFNFNIGVGYSSLQDSDKAIKHLELALAVWEKLGNKPEMLKTLKLLAQTLVNYDWHFVESYDCLKKYLKVATELGDKKAMAEARNLQGNAHLKFEYYLKNLAINEYQEALRISREINDQSMIAANLSALADSFVLFGDYRQAVRDYREALSVATAAGQKDLMARSLRGLGEIFEKTGDYKKAVDSYRQALKLYRETGNPAGLGNTHTALGQLYLSVGEHQKALLNFEMALKNKFEAGTATHWDEFNLGSVYLDLGDFEKAEKKFKEFGAPPAIMYARLNLLKKNYEEAIRYFLGQSMDHKISRETESLFASQCGLGLSYLGLKNYREAQSSFEGAIELSEDQREALTDNEKSRFFSSRIEGFYRTEPYEGLVQALTALRQNEKALYYSENLKARALAEAIARGHFMVGKSVAPEILKEEAGLREKIRLVRKEMKEIMHRGAMGQDYHLKEDELMARKAEQGKFLGRLRQLYPEYASINYPQPVSAANIKLNPGEVLVEFEVTDQKSFAFFLSGGKTHVREIPMTRKELKEKVLTYRNYFEGIESSQDLLSFKAGLGKELFALLFGNMLGQLPAGTTLIVVPDEFLGVLPFEALITEMPAKEQVGEGKYGPFPLGVKYLGDKFSLVYAQSATSLMMLRTLKKGLAAEAKALAVCDPVFSPNDKRLKAAPASRMDTQVAEMESAIREWKKMGVAGLKKRGEGTPAPEAAPAAEPELFPRLEKTAEIARAVKGLFGDKSTVLIGKDAREEDVVKLPFPSFRYVTFGTHGILDNALPWVKEPALVLSQVGNSDGYDGYLTMSEVMGLKMGAEVVTLTACQTGVGENLRGEGVMGMGRAFQFAGAGNVLMSLWSVAEDATVALSNEFFNQLKAGKNSKEALRLARAEIRRAGYEHPFYWSAFILVGN